jgi:hypothetical protein
MACSQCGKPAVAQTANGNPLCVDCLYKLQQVYNTQFAQMASVLNHLLGIVELHTGFGTPLVQVPPPMGNPQVTLNNITLNQSVVGAINTGEVQKLDVMMSRIRLEGDTQFATALQRFTQAVVDSDELTPEDKNTILEQLSFLTTQHEVPLEQRQRAVGKTVISGIANAIVTAGGLAEVWQVLEPMLFALF